MLSKSNETEKIGKFIRRSRSLQLVLLKLFYSTFSFPRLFSTDRARKSEFSYLPFYFHSNAGVFFVFNELEKKQSELEGEERKKAVSSLPRSLLLVSSRVPAKKTERESIRLCFDTHVLFLSPRLRHDLFQPFPGSFGGVFLISTNALRLRRLHRLLLDVLGFGLLSLTGPRVCAGQR